MSLLLALPLVVLAQQQGIAARLDGRVPATVAAVAESLGTAARARGLPIDPLIQKAIEGGAKGVPAERVSAALRLVVAQLDTAAAGLRAADVTPDTLAIAAGAFAITAGLNGGDVASIARSTSRADAALVVGLRVAGTLAALGVPPQQSADLVSATLASGRPATDLLALPGRVQAEMARGVPAAQAAAGLARAAAAAAAQGRHGPPPGRGQPPSHPTPPQHP
ncbi:MAG TPA: hypothetical protein VL549_08020 [Gemmatimonadales bacterium]|nr:hypothetical protein [Gemmatimonadales bacterium]